MWAAIGPRPMADGDPAFPQAGGAGDQQVLGPPDPAAVGEMGEDGAVEAAGRAQVGVLDAGGMAQGGELQPGGEAAGVPLGGFAVDEQAEALLEGHDLAGRGAALVVERLGHAGQAEGNEAVAGGMGEHDVGLLLNGSSAGRGCWRGAGAQCRGRDRGRPSRGLS